MDARSTPSIVNTAGTKQTAPTGTHFYIVAILDNTSVVAKVAGTDQTIQPAGDVSFPAPIQCSEFTAVQAKVVYFIQ